MNSISVGHLTARNPAVAARAAEEIITRGCAHICFPPPARVRVMRRSLFPGVPSALDFMPYPRHASGRECFRRVCVRPRPSYRSPSKGRCSSGRSGASRLACVGPELNQSDKQNEL